MADAQDDDDLDDEDVEALDMTACKERRRELVAERERQEEYVERLQVKLKALNSELAARREEVERINQQTRDLHQEEKRRGEEGRKESEALSLFGVSKQAESDEVTLTKIRTQMEESLQEETQHNAQTRSARNEHGIRLFDEMSLMVEKPPEEQQKEASYIDTVLITWIKGSDVKEIYNLTYRVDRNMTSKKLREDACLYWGISEVEYILKTVHTNSKIQDDVTIQNCFRSDEDAHLALVKKTPKDSKTLPAELQAIKAKRGLESRKPKERDGENQPKQLDRAAQNADFYKQMDVVPGFKEFMVQRDQDVKGHLKRIRLQSICVYLTLAITTLLSAAGLRPADEEYTIREGTNRALASPRVNPETGLKASAFRDIKSREGLWEFISFQVPTALLAEDSHLRRDSFLPGHLRIRMQQVKPASSEFCNHMKSVPSGVVCLAEEYSEGTAGTEDLQSVKDVWTNRSGVDGRSAGVVPWKHVPRETQLARFGDAKEAGRLGKYDSSGYAADYDLQSNNATATLHAYMDDMATLKAANWISDRTRAVHLTFVLYNGNHDFWTSVRFMLETPASGMVYPWEDLAVFRMVVADYGTGRTQLVVDILRLVLVVYVVTFHAYWEVSQERRRRESHRTWLHVGTMLLVDMVISGFFLYIFVVRYVIFGAARFTSVEKVQSMRPEHLSTTGMAYLYQQHTIAEAAVLFFVIFRLLDYLRVNRHIYIIWTTIAHSLLQFGYFLLVFLPLLVSFAFLGHCIWRAHHPQYRTFWTSVTSTLMMLNGDLDFLSMSISDRPLVILYMVVFLLIMFLILINSCAAVVMQVYQRTRVAAGYTPEDYAWGRDQYVEWCLWSPVASLYGYFRPRSKKKSAGTESDD